MKYATPLHLEPGSSRLAACWLVPVHAAAVGVTPFLALPGWLLLALLVVTLASLRRSWSLHVTRRHPAAIRRFTWGSGLQCTLRRQDGAGQAGVLAEQAFVMPWLVILYFRQGRQRRSLFILPDMLSRESFRRLRVRLNIEIGTKHIQARL